MSERQRILLSSIGIMVGVALSTAVIALYVVYESGLKAHRSRLEEVAQSRARLIEAVARFDVQYSEHDVPGGAEAATLRQVIEAHEKFEGFGRTGEFTLARREGDQIVWLLRHRHNELEAPPPTPFESEMAEPMRRALSGECGTVVALDYRGVKVLAAYEKIHGVDWGVVAKIDLAEIRSPILRAGLQVSGIALLAVAVAVGFILRVTSRLLRRIELRTEELGNAHERLRFHASETFLAVERERRRLAVDLHDGLGQLLALANIKLGVRRSATGVDQSNPQLKEVEDLILEARTLSKQMTLALCPPVLYEVGLMAAIRWLVSDLQERYELEVAVEEHGERSPLDVATRVSLFRSLNELLINVSKHAQTNKALVRVSQSDETLTIIVEDMGVGFDASSSSDGYGLLSVRERTHHLGGDLKIESVRRAGTRIALTVPLDSAGAEADEGSA